MPCPRHDEFHGTCGPCQRAKRELLDQQNLEAERIRDERDSVLRAQLREENNPFRYGQRPERRAFQVAA